MYTKNRSLSSTFSARYGCHRSPLKYGFVDSSREEPDESPALSLKLGKFSNYQRTPNTPVVGDAMDRGTATTALANGP